MSELVARLRRTVDAAEKVREFWERDISEKQKSIVEEEQNQFAAHQLSSALNGVELNDAEFEWIEMQHRNPSQAIANSRSLIDFARTDIDRCDAEISLVRGLIEKLEAKQKQ